jgi:hypothetical protein
MYSFRAGDLISGSEGVQFFRPDRDRKRASPRRSRPVTSADPELLIYPIARYRKSCRGDSARAFSFFFF